MKQFKEIREYKYLKYSDLMKAYADSFKKDGGLGPASKKIKKELEKEKKKLGVKEDNVNEAKLETIVLSYDLIKLIGGMSVMKKIMKKHNAYPADKQNVKGKLAISSKIAMGPKGGLIDSLNDILIQQEKG